MVTAVVLYTSHALFGVALYTSATLLFEVPRVNKANDLLLDWTGKCTRRYGPLLVLRLSNSIAVSYTHLRLPTILLV